MRHERGNRVCLTGAPAHLLVEQLTIRYRRAQAAVSRLSLECRPGELVALLGPSGSGKSSTLRCIGGLLAPESGDIRLDGTSILHLPPERRGFGLVLQHPTLFPHLSIIDNVAFGLQMSGVRRGDRRRQALAMLAAVQLESYGARRPHELSGGQQQRVALARALAVEPCLLLLDEPFAALDPGLREEMRTLVRQLQRAQGVTTLLVTHDQTEAAGLADRIALLIDGRVQQVAPPEIMYRRPATTAVARFFGAQNLLPGTLRDDGRIVTELGPLRAPSTGHAPGPVTVMIRPEHIRVHHQDEPGIAAQVRECHFLGTGYRYIVDACSVPLAATTVEAAFRPGDAVHVTLPPEHLWLLAT
jgi:ABC-type Fe3+/spermidine/putrescine transport system ATPase subunit